MALVRPRRFEYCCLRRQGSSIERPPAIRQSYYRHTSVFLLLCQNLNQVCSDIPTSEKPREGSYWYARLTTESWFCAMISSDNASKSIGLLNCRTDKSVPAIPKAILFPELSNSDRICTNPVSSCLNLFNLKCSSSIGI
jgi:hypothetical protein